MEQSSLDPLLHDTAASVKFQSNQGSDVTTTLLRLTPQSVTGEIFDPALILRASEVLNEFKIVLRNRTIYSGNAVVRSVVNAGSTTIFEVALDDGSWTDTGLGPGMLRPESLGGEFKEFVRGWQRFYLVADDYKVVTADLQTFLYGLRRWLEQVELKIRSVPEEKRHELENEIAHELRGSVTSAISSMFERFEAVSDKIEEDLQPAHRAFGQRQLHSHMLCAPFIHRTYAKPLGYAGDYEMMNMIVRNGYEGSTLFAKLVHAYMLDQAPAHAVRNRVGYLAERILEETARVARLGRIANIYNVACGPAREVENFLAEHSLSDQAQFRLLDFNEETLSFTASRMSEIKRRHQRRTPVEMVKNSVHSLLKAQGKSALGERRYDLIYSSGLYDYLGDRVCKALNTYMYEQLLPGGLLVVGNFNTNNPIQRQMEHILEWFLIYRDSRQVAALAPEQAPSENCVVRAEHTGTNIFLEVRKPQ